MIRDMMNTPSILRDDSYVRIHYVRYADDFIIGVEGSIDIARQVLRRVEEFSSRELHLKLHPEKTCITKYVEKPVSFLGFKISGPHRKNIRKPLETVIIKKKKVTRRKKVKVRIYMDTNKVLKKLKMRGMIRERTSHSEHANQTYKGTFVGNIINLDHEDIIKYYNSVIRGLHNYYDFVDNKRHLYWIV